MSNKLQKPRLTTRSKVVVEAKLIADNTIHSCSMLDLSSGGAKIHIAQLLEQEAAIEIEIEELGCLKGHIAWSSETYHGIQFDDEAEEIANRLKATLAGKRG